MTEWGFANGRPCPIDDERRRQVIEIERKVFKHFVEQGRLAAIICYCWTGRDNKKEDPAAIFRCGALTSAGKAALRPLLD
jgi:hypothetical protein